MKKFVTTFAFATICCLTSSAQLMINQEGIVQLGDGPNATIITTPIPSTDSITTVRIAGPGPRMSGGKIVFGAGNSTYIQHSIYSNTPAASNNALNICAPGGISYFAGNGGAIFQYNPKISNINGIAPFVFSTNLQAPQYLTSSDSRLKCNIEPINGLARLIKELAPVKYSLKNNVSNSTQYLSSSSSIYPSVAQYGFIAQEVREIYPDLVYEDADGMLSIDYTGFIPILVEAIQELQKQVDEQQEIIENLYTEISPNWKENKNNTLGAKMAQNRPNPFNSTTHISCMVPSYATSAFICISDLTGNMKLRKDILDRGDVEVSIQGSVLNPGIYLYTLVIDGTEIDTKRMILTD